MSVSYHRTVGFVSVGEYDSDGPLTFTPVWFPCEMKSASRDKKMTLMVLESPPILAPEMVMALQGSIGDDDVLTRASYHLA